MLYARSSQLCNTNTIPLVMHMHPHQDIAQWYSLSPADNHVHCFVTSTSPSVSLNENQTVTTTKNQWLVDLNPTPVPYSEFWKEPRVKIGWFLPEILDFTFPLPHFLGHTLDREVVTFRPQSCEYSIAMKWFYNLWPFRKTSVAFVPAGGTNIWTSSPTHTKRLNHYIKQEL